MKTSYLFILGSLASLAACSSSVEPQGDLATQASPLYKGPNDSFFAPGTPIQVCWDSLGFEDEKAVAQAAIDRTWVAQANLDVTWESTCPIEFRSRRVRLWIGPHTDDSNDGGNGQAQESGPAALVGPGGISIMFWFKLDHTTLPSRIEYLAVHEFGHILGFSHEQDQNTPAAIACRTKKCKAQRDMTFDDCMVEAAKNEGGTPIGAYDPLSVMNYCRAPAGALSPDDEVGVRKVYGKRPRARDEDMPASSLVAFAGMEVAATRSASGSVQVLDHTVPSSWGSIPPVDIGGNVVGTPVLAATASTLYVFARGADNAVWYKQRTAGGVWSPSATGWISLGGVISARPAVAVSPSGRLDLFVRGAAGDIHHKALYSGAWVPSISTWEPLGGSTLGAPVAVSVGENRPQVYAVASDRSLVRVAADAWGRFTASTPWENLGGQVTSTPAVVSTEPGKVDIVVKGIDGKLYQKSFNGLGWSPASGYRALDRAIVGAPALVSGAPGRLDLFAQDPYGQVIHTWAQGRTDIYPAPSPVLSNGWDELRGLSYGTPAAVAFGPRLDALAIGTTDAPQALGWTGSSWQSWESTPMQSVW